MKNIAGSNTPDSVAWYGDNSSSSTHGVGTKTPNVLGLYDMSGNIYEWCSDSYNKKYVTGTGNNPKESLKGQCRVYRGGSWFLIARDARTANHAWRRPDLRCNIIGFH